MGKCKLSMALTMSNTTNNSLITVIFNKCCYPTSFPDNSVNENNHNRL